MGSAFGQGNDASDIRVKGFAPDLDHQFFCGREACQQTQSDTEHVCGYQGQQKRCAKQGRARNFIGDGVESGEAAEFQASN